MFATLEGAAALDVRLTDLPRGLRARLETKGRELAAALAARVRDEKLSGQAVATRSGALKASIFAEVVGDETALTAIVGSTGDVKYAAIQEFGGRTAAHEILADKGRALAFLAGAGLRFAPRVNHPGSTLSPRAYLSSVIEDARDEIVAGLATAIPEAWNEP